MGLWPGELSASLVSLRGRLMVYRVTGLGPGLPDYQTEPGADVHNGGDPNFQPFVDGIWGPAVCYGPHGKNRKVQEKMGVES